MAERIPEGRSPSVRSLTQRCRNITPSARNLFQFESLAQPLVVLSRGGVAARSRNKFTRSARILGSNASCNRPQWPVKARSW